MSAKEAQQVRLLQTLLWDMRRLIEGELRELTEAQERLDTFVASPSAERAVSMAADLDDRFKTLVRTNERVLQLLYDACGGTQKLADQ